VKTNPSLVRLSRIPDGRLFSGVRRPEKCCGQVIPWVQVLSQDGGSYVYKILQTSSPSLPEGQSISSPVDRATLNGTVTESVKISLERSEVPAEIKMTISNRQLITNHRARCLPPRVWLSGSRNRVATVNHQISSRLHQEFTRSSHALNNSMVGFS